MKFEVRPFKDNDGNYTQYAIKEANGYWHQSYSQKMSVNIEGKGWNEVESRKIIDDISGIEIEIVKMQWGEK